MLIKQVALLNLSFCYGCLHFGLYTASSCIFGCPYFSELYGHTLHYQYLLIIIHYYYMINISPNAFHIYIFTRAIYITIYKRIYFCIRIDLTLSPENLPPNSNYIFNQSIYTFSDFLPFNPLLNYKKK